MKKTYLKPNAETAEIETNIIAASAEAVQTNFEPRTSGGNRSSEAQWGDLWK